MKLRKRLEFKPEVATGSLNDIMFFLLLFFLLVATFANPNVIKLLLPKSASNQTLDKKQITLSITKEKNYYIDKEQIQFNKLEGSLKAIKQKISDVTIVLRTDNSLTIQDLIDVLAIGNKLQIKMILATEKRGG
ncbi:MAG: biopolymer transporter ExbD [Prolixibacteraceae bacterium]|jgi:biopolymer transport protein ExbD|nr:biopolymer transporter ExbD [Prolixibacteraceae bacterium]